jgi:hypothetical protein
VFESSAGEVFSLARPAMSAEREAEVVEVLRGILDEEGVLEDARTTNHCPQPKRSQVVRRGHKWKTKSSHIWRCAAAKA